MPLDHSLVGVPTEPQERSWTSKDALLYAVGVGAGLGDPLAGTRVHHRELRGRNPAGAADVRGAGGAAADQPPPGGLRPGPARARRAGVRTAPPAAGRGHGADRLHGDRHLRQALGRAGGDRERGRGRGDRREARDVEKRRVHPGRGRIRRRSRPRRRLAAARPGPRPPGGAADPAGAGAAVPPVRRPEPAARRPEVRRPGRVQPPDPARPVHLRGDRPGPAAHAVRLGPGPVRVDVRAVHPPGPARRHAGRVDLAAG